MADRTQLTTRQQQVIDFVGQFISEHGYGPSIREIQEGLQGGSPSTIRAHLQTLQIRGLITQQPGVARSIQLVNHEAAGLPLLGVIPAGMPIEACEVPERIDFAAMYDPGNHFVLRVEGDSMIGDGIFDGDLAVFRVQQTCNDGQIVAARVDGDEVTLKRFYRTPKKIRLQPSNPIYRPIYRTDVEILGTLAGTHRVFG